MCILLTHTCLDQYQSSSENWGLPHPFQWRKNTSWWILTFSCIIPAIKMKMDCPSIHRSAWNICRVSLRANKHCQLLPDQTNLFLATWACPFPLGSWQPTPASGGATSDRNKTGNQLFDDLWLHRGPDFWYIFMRSFWDPLAIFHQQVCVGWKGGEKKEDSKQLCLFIAPNKSNISSQCNNVNDLKGFAIQCLFRVQKVLHLLLACFNLSGKVPLRWIWLYTGQEGTACAAWRWPGNWSCVPLLGTSQLAWWSFYYISAPLVLPRGLPSRHCL